MIIDMQRIFGEPTSEWFTPGYASASAGIQLMLGAFESRVCLTRFLAPEQPAGVWIDYYEKWPFALDPVNAPLYELSEEFKPIPATMVDRTTFGKWDAEVARDLGYPAETALQAADAGVHVIVAADACAGVTEEDHQRALDTMALYRPLIDIAEVDSILATLDK